MSDIPLELWFHITSFISDSEVWKLRAVNRILLQVALDRRFRRVTLHLPFSKPTKSKQSELRKLRRLTYVVQPDRAPIDSETYSRDRNPIIADRVREVVFSLGLCHVGRPGAKKWIWPPFKTVHQRISNLFDKKPQLAIRAFQTMENVTKMDVRCHTSFYLEYEQAVAGNLRYVVSAMTAFSSQLRSLSLTCNQFRYLAAALSSSVLLPHLENLAMTCLNTDTQMHGVSLISQTENTVVSFVNRHHLTIRSLQFTTQKETQHLAIITRIEHLQHLDCLHIVVHDPEALSIKNFIETHSQTLRKLTLWENPLHLRSPFLASRHDLFGRLKTPLTRLKCLKVALTPSSPFHLATSLVEYVKTYSPTLTCLDIEYETLLHSDWQAFLRADWSSLRDLRLQLCFATLDVFDNISRVFSYLTSLSLRVTRVLAEHTDPDSDYEASLFVHPPIA